MIEVEIGERDRLDSALGSFRRRLIRSGRFADMRTKRFYEKPSEVRKSKVQRGRAPQPEYPQNGPAWGAKQ